MTYQCRQFSNERASLDDEHYIGMENRRRVFMHPDYPNLCIKVARASHIRRELNRRGLIHKLMPTHWRDDNWLESRAYQQPALSVITEATQRHIPSLYGWQETSIGMGLVFDYYHLGNGQPAPNLRDVILSGGITADIRRAVDGLKDFILHDGPWMRHPSPENIVYATDGQLKLVDCMGTYNMRLQRYIPAIRKRRRKRHNSYLETAIGNLQTRYERDKQAFQGQGAIS